MNLVPALAVTTQRIALTDPLFISDLHLSEAQPRTLARFEELLAGEACAHAELVILGDLFEYWAGDDAADNDPVAQRVIVALRALRAAGVVLFVMQGNRDLLLGADFAAATGATLLADPTQATIGSETVLLAHGDTYCTRDLAYQRFRAQA
ncbi:MAG: UDP-2,3-diacylglucosamine diphosphatase, partial [Burkholderiaceae bacterium]|nr:UDP-2,3-diacylglucosamine diphosphatase [Burkholderiaceae bacterium]